MIFLAPKGLISHPQYTQLVSYALAISTLDLILSLVVIPWHCHLQYAGESSVAGCTFANRLSWALQGLFTLPHGAKPHLLSILSSNLRAGTAAEAEL